MLFSEGFVITTITLGILKHSSTVSSFFAFVSRASLTMNSSSSGLEQQNNCFNLGHQGEARFSGFVPLNLAILDESSSAVCDINYG